jgi:hypothetical protein
VIYKTKSSGKKEDVGRPKIDGLKKKETGKAKL